MSLPSEYVIEDAISSVDDVIVYRAEHPIHGKVNVYQPDPTLPPQVAEQVRRQLYENGLRMRELSMLEIPLTAKALEVSQDPREPYIVTKHLEHNLEELISNGITLRPKRMFGIIEQVLEAITNIAVNGHAVGHVQPRQIRLAGVNTGDISFNIVESKAQRVDVAETVRPVSSDGPPEGTGPPKPPSGPKVGMTQPIDETESVDDASSSEATGNRDDVRLLQGEQAAANASKSKELRVVQRNMYTLGLVSYQLLFGRKYQAQDEVAGANISRLAGRWRRILEKTLWADLERRYDSYEAMLGDLGKALSRNRRAALASLPFLVIAVVVIGYFAYERYHRHKIMTSEAGQAIERFLDIVNRTEDELPEVEKPKAGPSAPDEESILEPFEEIEPVEQ